MTAQTNRRLISRQHPPLDRSKELPLADKPTPPPRRNERPRRWRTSRRGHIGLTVLGSIVTGLVLGLVLVLGVFAGSEEATITGSALTLLGTEMLILFLLAGRRTDQPQPWALAPASALADWALRSSSSSQASKCWAGWDGSGRCSWRSWSSWSVRGPRRSLRNWSRRARLYPALAVLGLVALGGAFETVAEATRQQSRPSIGRTYTVQEDRQLYLECFGRRLPDGGASQRALRANPPWAWVGRGRSHARRAFAASTGRAKAGVVEGAVSQDAGVRFPETRAAFSRPRRLPGPYVLAGDSVGGTYALAYAMTFPADVAGVALIDASTRISSTSLTIRASTRCGGAPRPPCPRSHVPGSSACSVRAEPSAASTDARRAAHAFGASPRELRADRVEFARCRLSRSDQEHSRASTGSRSTS